MRFTVSRPHPGARRFAAIPRLPHPTWHPDFEGADLSKHLSATEFWDRLGD